MSICRAGIALVVGLFFCGLASAQSNVKAPWEEYDKLIHNRQALTALGQRYLVTRLIFTAAR